MSFISVFYIFHVRTGHEVVGKIHVKHVYEIAKIKKTDPSNESIDLEKICRMVIGTCKTMGVDVVA